MTICRGQSRDRKPPFAEIIATRAVWPRLRSRKTRTAQMVTSVARGRVTALALREAWEVRNGKRRAASFCCVAHATKFNAAGSVHSSRPVYSSRLRTPSRKLGRSATALGVEAKQASPAHIDAQRFRDAQRWRFARSPPIFPRYLLTEGWRNQGPHKRHNPLAGAPNLEMATRVSAGTSADPLYQTSLILRALARIIVCDSLCTTSLTDPTSYIFTSNCVHSAPAASPPERLPLNNHSMMNYDN